MESIEPYIIYLGQAACLAASVYFAKVGYMRDGVMLFLAFILMFQWGYIAGSLNAKETSQCLAMGISYYDCLPIFYRISAHGAQLGVLLLATSIMLIAKKIRRFERRKHV